MALPPRTPFVHRNLPRLLLQARESVMTHTRPGLRDQGLSDQQWRVLRVLGENHSQGGEGVEIGRIAREAFITGPSLSGMLTRMERDGLVQRQRDPSDQRRTVVCATEQGLARVDTLRETIETHYQWMEKHLGKFKLAQLYALLDEVIALDPPPSIDTPHHNELDAIE